MGLVLPDLNPTKVLPSPKLREVYLGYRFKKENLEELKGILLRGGHSTDIYQLRRIPQRFGFDAEMIDRVCQKGELSPASH